jgi:hypothetical protein
VGSQMMEFPSCNHVFCKKCVGNHFTERILRNFVNDIFCPDGGKCESHASPDLVCIYLFWIICPHSFYSNELTFKMLLFNADKGTGQR